MSHASLLHALSIAVLLVCCAIHVRETDRLGTTFHSASFTGLNENSPHLLSVALPRREARWCNALLGVE